MNLLSRAFVLLAAILFIGVLGAQAQEVQFSLTGPVDATAVVFTNPAAAGEITSSDAGFGFTLTPVSLIVGGVALPLGNMSSDYSLNFYNSSPITGGGGGFSALTNDGSTDAFATFGPQLYTGSENDPSFASLINAGPISLGDFDSGTAGAYTLTVTAVTPDVPEPSTLLLLAGALLPLGLLAKKLL
jgi:hypothetical protein